MKPKGIALLRWITAIFAVGLLFGGCASNQSESAEGTPSSPNDAVFAARQKMRITGLDNIRDMGGYKTVNGRTVKRGVIYRSDTLSKLKPEGITQIEALGIGHIFDLRSDSEIARKPDPEIKGAVYHHTEILADTPMLKWPETDEETIAFYAGPASRNYYIDASKYMVVSARSRESLKTILTIALENQEGKGLLWHCSGGKDRAGFVSAVFLSLLGLDNETITQEYLLTNIDRKEFDDSEREYMDAEYFHGDKTLMEGFRAVQEARREYVDIFLSGIQSLYGTVDNYLIQEVGFTQADLDKIKALYTE
jgi:protein-tyrosine phosphatase